MPPLEYDPSVHQPPPEAGVGPAGDPGLASTGSNHTGLLWKRSLQPIVL